MPRENANGARAKSGGRTVPAGSELIRLYADYLHGEYGDIDSDYVFINIWAEPRGQAWSYPAAYDLVRRLRAKTGLDFDPHWFRHSAATRWLRDGVPVEVVSKLLGHSSVAVTSAVYGHLTAADARAALEKAGWFTGREVTLVTGMSWVIQAGRKTSEPSRRPGRASRWPAGEADGRGAPGVPRRVCWCSIPPTRCSAAACAWWTGAGGMCTAAGCARVTCGGGTRRDSLTLPASRRP